jgi:hypothetical protein
LTKAIIFIIRKIFRTWYAHLQRASYISSPEKKQNCFPQILSQSLLRTLFTCPTLGRDLLGALLACPTMETGSLREIFACPTIRR